MRKNDIKRFKKKDWSKYNILLEQRLDEIKNAVKNKSTTDKNRLYLEEVYRQPTTTTPTPEAPPTKTTSDWPC